MDNSLRIDQILRSGRIKEKELDDAKATKSALIGNIAKETDNGKRIRLNDQKGE